jgi:hypothetical protein
MLMGAQWGDMVRSVGVEDRVELGDGTVGEGRDDTARSA